MEPDVLWPCVFNEVLVWSMLRWDLDSTQYTLTLELIAAHVDGNRRVNGFC